MALGTVATRPRPPAVVARVRPGRTPPSSPAVRPPRRRPIESLPVTSPVASTVVSLRGRVGPTEPPAPRCRDGSRPRGGVRGVVRDRRRQPVLRPTAAAPDLPGLLRRFGDRRPHGDGRPGRLRDRPGPHRPARRHPGTAAARPRPPRSGGPGPGPGGGRPPGPGPAGGAGRRRPLLGRGPDPRALRRQPGRRRPAWPGRRYGDERPADRHPARPHLLGTDRPGRWLAHRLRRRSGPGPPHRRACCTAGSRGSRRGPRCTTRRCSPRWWSCFAPSPCSGSAPPSGPSPSPRSTWSGPVWPSCWPGPRTTTARR